jgi:hypothetical protein
MTLTPYNDDDLQSYEVHSIFLKELAPELEKLLKRPVTVRTLENGHTLLFDEQGVHR